MVRETLFCEDGPLAGEQFAVDIEATEELFFTLENGRVAVYRVGNSYGSPCLAFIGYDPYA